MKVVAGSHGNDAIGPLTSVGRGMVWPDEWGPRQVGSIHIDRDVLRKAPARLADLRAYGCGGVRSGHSSAVSHG